MEGANHLISGLGELGGLLSLYLSYLAAVGSCGLLVEVG